MDFPDDYDDHALHVIRHNKFRLTVEFEELVKQYPIIAQMFADHIQYHALSLQEQVMREQATMAAMQPQPKVV
jgi:hypothetical protein